MQNQSVKQASQPSRPCSKICIRKHVVYTNRTTDDTVSGTFNNKSASSAFQSFNRHKRDLKQKGCRETTVIYCTNRHTYAPLSVATIVHECRSTLQVMQSRRVLLAMQEPVRISLLRYTSPPAWELSYRSSAYILRNRCATFFKMLGLHRLQWIILKQWNMNDRGCVLKLSFILN
jgi:hypothetical protein